MRGKIIPIDLISSLSFGRISARSAFLLLDMIRTTSTSTAQSVRLVVLLTKTRRSLRHLDESFSLPI